MQKLKKKTAEPVLPLSDVSPRSKVLKGGQSSLLPLPKMPKGKKANGKKVALAPAVVKKQETKKMVNPLFEKRSKSFDTGQDI